MEMKPQNWIQEFQTIPNHDCMYELEFNSLLYNVQLQLADVIVNRESFIALIYCTGIGMMAGTSAAPCSFDSVNQVGFVTVGSDLFLLNSSSPGILTILHSNNIKICL